MMNNSWFSHERLPVNDLLLIYYLWLQKVFVTLIASITKHSTHTISDHVKNIRNLVQSHVQVTNQKIGGKDIIVEIDESHFGHNKYWKGKYKKGVKVFGAVERTKECQYLYRLYLIEKNQHY